MVYVCYGWAVLETKPSKAVKLEVGLEKVLLAVSFGVTLGKSTEALVEEG